MFEHMKKGSWTISTSTFDEVDVDYHDVVLAVTLHEDKVAPVTNALNAAMRNYSVGNEIIDDTWITVITLE